MEQEEDLRTIVADALEEVAAELDAAAQDDFNLASHDNRYHKHGFKVGGTCKYRGADVAGDDIRKYYEDIGKSLPSLDELFARYPKLKFEPIFDVTPDELYENYNVSRADALNLQAWGTATTREVEIMNLIAFLEVLTDIKRRHKNFALENTLFFSWDMYEKTKWYGLSTMDNRDPVHASYISIGDAFSEGREIFPLYHTLRHELGHNLSTLDVEDAWDIMIRQEFQSKPLYREYIRTHLPRYAMEGVKNDEAIAETFAIYTHPFYVRGALPQGMEEVVELMLGEETNTKESVAMDSKHEPKGYHEKRDGVPPLNPAYNLSGSPMPAAPKGVIRWFDYAKGGFIHFKNYEERFRYILNAYGIPREWADAYVKEYQGREWDEIDIARIKFLYRRTNVSLEDAIEYDKGWL